MRKFNISMQQDQSDCGVACLDTIIRYYRGVVSKEELRVLSGTSKKGTTLLGLYQASIELGFEVEGLEANDVKDLLDIEKPVILHVLNSQQIEHYVVYWGYQNEKFIIGDPAVGILYYDIEEIDRIWVSKYLLKIEPGINFKNSTLFKSPRKWNWFYGLIKRDIISLLMISFMGILISILGLSTAVFTQRLIDDILPKASVELLVYGVTFLALLLLCRVLVIYFRGKLLIKQNREFNSRINEKFYAILLRLPKYFFDTRNSGDVISRINDARKIHSFISTLIGSTFIDLFSVIIAVIIISSYSTVIGFSTIVFISVYFFIAHRHAKQIKISQREILGNYGYLESHYIDTIGAIPTIKSSSRIDFFEKLTKMAHDRLQNTIFEVANRTLKFSLTSEISSIAFSILILSSCSFMIFNDIFTMGKLVAIISISGLIVPSLIRLSNFNIQFQEAEIVIDRMFEFATIRSEYESDNKDDISITSVDLIEIQNLSFQYSGQINLLRNITLEVKRGKIVSIIGQSGSGKSTILQILVKFYQYERGRINVNQVIDLNRISTLLWRKLVSYIPQEIKLFNGTVAFNICLSDSEEDMIKVIQICRNYGFESLFDKLPQGLSTPIGATGINLSGGQVQLVGFARALFTDPKFLFLDEITSSMDIDTEEFVLKLLMRLKQQMGVLLVTHKFSVSKIADIVYTLEDGEITDIGTPNDLLTRDSLFKRLRT